MSDKTTQRARTLRSNPTDAEKKIWKAIQYEQLGAKFRRQHPLGPYFLDFYCPDKKLAVEIDGGQHSAEKDCVRSQFIEGQGIKILRFWNNEVFENLEGVLMKISEELQSRPPLTPPSRKREGGEANTTPPSLRREGGHRGAGGNTLSSNLWRKDFPALNRDKPLAFLDSAASAQKPQTVIDTMKNVAETHYANIHRGLYEYSQKTTSEFEAVRGKVARFINAPSENEIVFTRNSTEAINLVAHAWGLHFLHADDEIILTEMEHHANIVPWHVLRDLTGIVIKYIPVTKDGELDLDKLDTLLTKRTKLVSFVHVSNALGTVNPAKEIISRVRAFNPEIKIMVDGSQSAVHGPIDVKALGCDWFVMTGHKLYGPTGVGMLWGREEILSETPPYQGGGDMIERVTLHGIKYRKPPQRFEAGTPAIIEVIGMGAAIDYMNAIGWDAITAHEHRLVENLYNRLTARKDLRIIGTPKNRAGLVSFLMDGASSADVGMILDKCGVAVRVGHHCCQPLLDIFGIEGTIRASVALYNTEDDLDALEAGLDKARKLLS